MINYKRGSSTQFEKVKRHGQKTKRTVGWENITFLRKLKLKHS